MRIVFAVSILIASVSSASAQFTMDHGHAADAVQAIYARQAAADAKARAIANGTPLLPSQSTDFAVGSRATIKVIARTDSGICRVSSHRVCGADETAKLLTKKLRSG